MHIASTSADEIDVFVLMDSDQYDPPELPQRTECVYDRDHLDRLSSGSGIQILGLEAITIALAALLPWGGLGLAAYVKYILGRGIKTDKYEPLPELEVMDASRAVVDMPVNDVPPGHGIVVDDEQHYPVFGWIEAGWRDRSTVGVAVSAVGEGGEFKDAGGLRPHSRTLGAPLRPVLEGGPHGTRIRRIAHLVDERR